MAGISVMLAMPTHRDLPPETVVSLMATQQACIDHSVPFQVYFGKGSSLVHHARSKIAWQFLQTDLARLFWIDSDMEWSGASFMRLLALSTVKDVVAAAYPGRNEPGHFFVEFVGEDNMLADEHGCLPGKELGLGFSCIQRHVIEELAAKAPKVRFPDVNDGKPIPHIFRLDIDGEYARGEDVAFFSDVRALGYRVNVDPTITLGHIGPKVFRGAVIDHLQKET